MAKLDVGEQAPDFVLYTHKAEPTSLGDLNGSKNILLLFYPGAFSKVCTAELKDVNGDLDWYTDHNTNVAAVSTDSTLVLAEFRRQNGFNFTLLSDHSAEVAKAYGCKYNADFTHMNLDRIAKRAIFLIDRQLAIRYAKVYDDADEKPDFTTVKEIIKSIP